MEFKVWLQWFLHTCLLLALVAAGAYFYDKQSFLFGVSFTKLTFSMSQIDKSRHKKAEKTSINSQYQLHQLEMLFNQEWCKKNPGNATNMAWVTAFSNNNDIAGGVYLGYALQRLSCVNTRIAFVVNQVNEKSKEALIKAGFDVRVVDALDCSWMDRKYERTPSGRVKGSHMKLQSWKLIELDAVVYLHPTVMPLINIDDLFQMGSGLVAGYGAQPGLIDPTFDTGLLKLNPSKNQYLSIVEYWTKLSAGGGCANEDDVLWRYFVDNNKWHPLPYAYNVRQSVYHPMKVYRFDEQAEKPWNMKRFPTNKEIESFKGPFLVPGDMYTMWWRHYNNALKEFALEKWHNEISNEITI